MQALGDEQVEVQVLSVGVGAVSSHDINQAASSGARLLAFNVPLAHSALTAQVSSPASDDLKCHVRVCMSTTNSAIIL